MELQKIATKLTIVKTPLKCMSPELLMAFVDYNKSNQFKNSGASNLLTYQNTTYMHRPSTCLGRPQAIEH